MLTCKAKIQNGCVCKHRAVLLGLCIPHYMKYHYIKNESL